MASMGHLLCNTCNTILLRFVRSRKQARKIQLARKILHSLRERGEPGRQLPRRAALLEEDAHQDRLERDGAPRAGAGSGVVPCRGEQFVEQLPVLQAQRAPERLPRLLLAVQFLGEGEHRAAHYRTPFRGTSPVGDISCERGHSSPASRRYIRNVPGKSVPARSSSPPTRKHRSAIP